ncbi:MAG: pitrilysin family protein [Gemmatimonadota bacterium]
MPSTLSGRWTNGVVRSVLPNSLTVLVQPDHSAPAVSIVTHVKAGFFDEPDHWAGISHVLEHMFFKGTPRRGVGEIAQATKGLGGYLNAGTSYDYTTYYVVLPARGFEDALEIQADALRNSLIDAGELGRELKVIIEEAKRKFDTPSAVTYERLNEVMFDRHRIRRWRIGTEQVLAGFTREDVNGYYRSRYVPSRTIVSIVGAVSVETAMAAVERHYGDWSPGDGAVDPSPAEPGHTDIRTRTLRGDVVQAELSLGWHGVPALDPDSSALDLGASVLATGRGSWLYRALRDPGLVTSIGAYHYSPTDLGIFSIGAELEPHQVRPAIREVGAALRRLRSDGPTDVDLRRARALIQARWARRLESTDGRASAFAAAQALRGVEWLDQEYARIEAVTPADIQQAAARYLTPEAASAVVYLSERAGVPLEAGELAEALAAESRPAQPVSAPTPIEPFPPPLAVGGTTRAGTLHVPLFTADLLVRRKPGVPLVTLGVYRRRTSFDPPNEAGVGALMVRSAVRGAAGLDAAGLALAFEGLGGSLGTSIAGDWYGFSASVLTEHLGEAARLLRSVMLEPTLADDEVIRERATLAEDARGLADDMFRFPVQLAFGEAFGDAGYGLPITGLPETVPRLTPTLTRAWHKTQAERGRLTVLAVGDIDPERAAEILAGLYSTPAGHDISQLTRPPLEWHRGGVRALDRAKNQTAFAMVFPGPARRDPDRYAADVWAAIASGLGGRLFAALRDRRSLAYTVMASSWQRQAAGALVTYIATSPEREEEARSAMLEELAKFRAEPASEEELRRAVTYLAGQAEVQRQTSGGVASELLDAWLLGSGLDEMEDPGSRYRAVSAEAVLEVARRCLDEAARSEGVIRGHA